MNDLLSRLFAALASRYTIERELGRGGMATVYLAHDLKHHRRVALKVLRPELTMALGPDRFLREIEIAAQFVHPHIVPVFDSGEVDGCLYYVMPYVSGESLRSRLTREGQLPVGDALDIACEVANALDYAHSHGIVHRDIKPENILLEGGHAMVADFGIARAISLVASSSDARLTSAGLALGTPLYMSPEQAAGHQQLDGRADIYSLGCVLYEMLAGEPPFTGPTPQVVMAKHGQESPPSLREKRTGVPTQLEQVVTKSLHKLPADRFANAAELAAALSAYRGGMPSDRAPTRRLNPKVWAAIILTVISGAVLTNVWRAAATPARGGIGVAVLPFEEGGRGSPGKKPRTDLLFSEALAWLPGLQVLDGSRLLEGNRNGHAIELAELQRKAKQFGAKYLITGRVDSQTDGSRLHIDVYTTAPGTPLARSEYDIEGVGLGDATARLALQSALPIIKRESLPFSAQTTLLTATSSAATLGHLLRGQTSLWHEDLPTASAEFTTAVQADSSCGLAYHRLSVVLERQHDFSTALSTVEAGLRRRSQFASLWVHLLQAQRHFLLGAGDSAINGFQDVVLEDRDNTDGWLGLGEALFHFGGYAGYRPEDAVSAFERLAALDSASVPISAQHLVDLALFKGDEAQAKRYVSFIRKRASRSSREAAIVLQFSKQSTHPAAYRDLRHSDRQALSELAAVWLRHMRNPVMADSLGIILTGPAMTPDDNWRGADVRLVALAVQGRWNEGLAAWRAVGGMGQLDSWMVQAELAGYPAAEIVDPMVQWAHRQVSAGLAPDFSLPLWDLKQQAFFALAQRAVVRGDSSEVLKLLSDLDQHRSVTPATDPTPEALRASLQARLALLAADTTRAITLLRMSVARIAEPFTWYYPLTSMAQERLLLAELLLTVGDLREGKEWLDSFSRTWSVGDALYARRVHEIESRIVE